MKPTPFADAERGFNEAVAPCPLRIILIGIELKNDGSGMEFVFRVPRVDKVHIVGLKRFSSVLEAGREAGEAAAHWATDRVSRETSGGT